MANQSLRAAEIVKAIYHGDPTSSAVRSFAGYSWSFHESPNLKVRFAVLTNERIKRQFISIAGETDVKQTEMSHNTSLKYMSVGGIPIAVHGGCFVLFSDIKEIITASARRGYEIHVSGHGMGGALAQMVALDVAQYTNVSSIVTFGQPKVFRRKQTESAHMVLKIAHEKTSRLVLAGDTSVECPNCSFGDLLFGRFEHIPNNDVIMYNGVATHVVRTNTFRDRVATFLRSSSSVGVIDDYINHIG